MNNNTNSLMRRKQEIGNPMMHFAQHPKIKDGGISDMVSCLNFCTLFVRGNGLFPVPSSSFTRVL